MIGSSCITSFCKDNNGMLWVGTDNDGIYALTEKLEPAKHFSHTNHPNSVPSTVIKLYEDSEYNICTLYKLDKIMNGDIQEIIDACIAADQAAKLANMNEEM